MTKRDIRLMARQVAWGTLMLLGYGATVSLLWLWFVTPLGLSAISPQHAAGIVLLVRLCTLFAEQAIMAHVFMERKTPEAARLRDARITLELATMMYALVIGGILKVLML